MNRAFFAAALAAPSVALAHAGHSHGWVDGLVHPLTGADHLLAALCVGLAGGLVARSRATLGAFAGALALGLALGVGFGGSALELGLALSVVAGGALAFGARATLSRGVILAAAAVGMLHGHAHGVELGGAGVGFAAALVAASAALATGGAALAQRVPAAARALGALVAVGYGAFALFG